MSHCHRLPRFMLACAISGLAALALAHPASALSGGVQGAALGHHGLAPAGGGGAALPLPEPGGPRASGTGSQQSQAQPPAGNPPADAPPAAAAPDSGAPAAEAPAAEEPAPRAEIIRDMNTLPEPVRKLRQAIVEAAASGDIERMRAIMDPGARKTDAPGENEDPIETLKSFSGDQDGLEILAIMLDLLQTGAARIESGTPEEVYVWPYFVGKPLSDLTAPEKVELLRIVTAGDLAAMDEAGGYNFYRIGISPDGTWKFIVSGD